MTGPTAARLAVALWALTLILVVSGVSLAALSPNGVVYDYLLEVSLIAPAFATVGAAIVWRRPSNSVGWTMLVGGICGGMQLAGGQYATTALLDPASTLTGGRVAAWFSGVGQMAAVVSMLFLLLLFPSGPVRSRVWRVLAWSAGIVASAAIIGVALRPGPFDQISFATNPFGLDALRDVLDLVNAVGGVGALILFVAVIAHVVARFVRSQGEERLQLKWFVYAATVGFVAILVVGETLGSIVWTAAPIGLAAAVGIAVLKYRLYDIDVIINRTLVYGALTALLGLTYVAGVAVLQQLFRPLTGTSELAVAGSTLAVAGLFRPARGSIQGFIDRRFYRRKYDAAQTLDQFSGRLKDEIDLDTLSAELVGVVANTVQPAHVALWLRTSGARG